MPSPSSHSSPSGAAGVRAVVEAADAALMPVHAARLAELGPDGSGLFAHYQALLEAGSFYRSGDIDRLAWVLNRMPRYDRYVVYRAGLGEMALALALAGRRVTAWEPNPARRAALEAGLAALSDAVRAAGGELVIAERDPGSIGTDPAGTSLGLAFDLLASLGDEAEAARRLFGVNALLYEPRLFLRVRDPETAGDEARDLLAGAGFDTFRPGPLAGLMFATRGAVQPARLRAAATVEPGPRRERASDGPARGLIAIVGSSFCGSTLLNALLGAHPSVAGGGELHRLTTPSEHNVCAICGETCPVWTPARRARANPDNIYDLAAEAFGRPVVCDASKMTDWFGDMQERHADIPATTILLAKHPVRQAASFLHKAALDDRKAAYRDPGHALRLLHAGYNRALATIGLDMILRYEDLVADPRGTVTAILARHGLDWDDAINGWQTAPHHHIGGNRGPRAQIARERSAGDPWLHRKYETDGVFMDNSYLETLDEETFAAVSNDPYAIEICEMFGYEPLDYPTRAA